MDITITMPLKGAVFAGDYIPAHDEMFDIAEEVGTSLAKLHAYVAKVRDLQQANAALVEFGQAIADATVAVTEA